LNTWHLFWAPKDWQPLELANPSACLKTASLGGSSDGLRLATSHNVNDWNRSPPANTKASRKPVQGGSRFVDNKAKVPAATHPGGIATRFLPTFPKAPQLISLTASEKAAMTAIFDSPD